MKKININKHAKLFLIIIIIFGIMVNSLINKEISPNDKMMYSKAISVSIKATLYYFASLLLLNYILNSLDIYSIIYLKGHLGTVLFCH